MKRDKSYIAQIISAAQWAAAVALGFYDLRLSLALALGIASESLALMFARPCHECGRFVWTPCEHRESRQSASRPPSPPAKRADA